MASWRIERLDTCPSTSTLCIERARAGEPAGLAIRSGQQTAGRGSRGRSWDTLDGNLALSVLLRPDAPAAEAGLWALAGAVALHSALSRFAPRLAIKWPNDILQDGAKAAGLLVDASTEDGRIAWLVIGMGANLRAAPPGGAVALGPHDPAAVATAVLDALADIIQAWQTAGTPTLIARWLAAAHPLGTPLRVRTAALDVAGTFAGLAPDGALLLATTDSGATEPVLRAFSTGEVLLGC